MFIVVKNKSVIVKSEWIPQNTILQSDFV